MSCMNLGSKVLVGSIGIIAILSLLWLYSAFRSKNDGVPDTYVSSKVINYDISRPITITSVLSVLSLNYTTSALDPKLHPVDSSEVTLSWQGGPNPWLVICKFPGPHDVPHKCVWDPSTPQTTSAGATVAVPKNTPLQICINVFWSADHRRNIGNSFCHEKITALWAP